MTYEVASPAELMFGVLIDGEALPGAEVYVWVVIKGPEAYAGKRMRLVLQRGRANSHDDWISGGQEWRPIGTIGEAQADERALAEGVILLRNK